MSLGLTERWREASLEVSGVGKSTNQFRKDVADATARIVLEHLRDIAAEGGNMDDGLWYRRLTELLEAIR